jgi:hypothetical protein
MIVLKYSINKVKNHYLHYIISNNALHIYNALEAPDGLKCKSKGENK